MKTNILISDNSYKLKDFNTGIRLVVVACKAKTKDSEFKKFIIINLNPTLDEITEEYLYTILSPLEKYSKNGYLKVFFYLEDPNRSKNDIFEEFVEYTHSNTILAVSHKCKPILKLMSKETKSCSEIVDITKL